MVSTDTVHTLPKNLHVIARRCSPVEAISSRHGVSRITGDCFVAKTAPRNDIDSVWYLSHDLHRLHAPRQILKRLSQGGCMACPAVSFDLFNVGVVVLNEFDAHGFPLCHCEGRIETRVTKQSPLSTRLPCQAVALLAVTPLLSIITPRLGNKNSADEYPRCFCKY
jgi:hypothetical protein